jgi:hypothetical protein
MFWQRRPTLTAEFRIDGTCWFRFDSMPAIVGRYDVGGATLSRAEKDGARSLFVACTPERDRNPPSRTPQFLDTEIMVDLGSDGLVKVPQPGSYRLRLLDDDPTVDSVLAENHGLLPRGLVSVVYVSNPAARLTPTYALDLQHLAAKSGEAILQAYDGTSRRLAMTLRARLVQTPGS